MKLTNVLLTTLLMSSAGAIAQTKVHHTSTKKDTAKTVMCGTKMVKPDQIDSVQVIQAKKIKHPRKTRDNCPGCGRG